MQYSKGKSCSFLKITRQQLNKVVHFQHPPCMLISIRISTCIPAAPHFTFFVPPPSRNDNNQVEEKQFSGLSTSLSRERELSISRISLVGVIPCFPSSQQITALLCKCNCKCLLCSLLSGISSWKWNRVVRIRTFPPKPSMYRVESSGEAFPPNRCCSLPPKDTHSSRVAKRLFPAKSLPPRGGASSRVPSRRGYLRVSPRGTFFPLPATSASSVC